MTGPTKQQSDDDLRDAAIDKDPYAAFDVAAPGGDLMHKPLPVRGYKPETDRNVQLVNHGKEIEAILIAYIKELQAYPDFDQRMLALAKTNIQQGCMWAYRSVFQPSED